VLVIELRPRLGDSEELLKQFWQETRRFETGMLSILGSEQHRQDLPMGYGVGEKSGSPHSSSLWLTRVCPKWKVAWMNLSVTI
jgi:hypothetical protein